MFMLPVAVLMSAVAPVKVASVGLEAIGIDEKRTAFYAERLADQLADQGLEVRTQRQIAAVLGMERQRALLGCGETETSCVAELASALGVDGILMGNLARVAAGFELSVKIVSSRDGGRLASFMVRASTEEALLEGIARAAKRLAAECNAVLRGGPAPSGPASEELVQRVGPSARVLGIIPAALGGGLLVTSAVLGSQSEARYTALTADGAVANAPGLRDEGKQLQTWANVSLGVGLAALSAGVAMFIFGGSAAPVAVLTPDGAVLGVAGVLP